jgi:hypothetical protein
MEIAIRSSFLYTVEIGRPSRWIMSGSKGDEHSSARVFRDCGKNYAVSIVKACWRKAVSHAALPSAQRIRRQILRSSCIHELLIEVRTFQGIVFLVPLRYCSEEITKINFGIAGLAL